MNGLPYYKSYPRDFFEGTVGMPFAMKGAYRLLLDLIYMHGGRLADNSRFISGHLGCSVRAWNGYRAALIKAGKISVDLGIISNFRADKETIMSRSFQDKQRENRRGSNKNNDLTTMLVEPKVDHSRDYTDTEREGRSKEERHIQEFGSTAVLGDAREEPADGTLRVIGGRDA